MVMELPGEIKVEIIRRVGLGGFRNLGPFILAGKEGRDAVFSPTVMKEVRPDEFIAQGSMANEGSIYQPFLLKFLSHGNVGAKYVEGVRMLSQQGQSEEAFALLAGAEHKLIFAVFAHGMFLICAGRFEEGMVKLNRIWEALPHVEQAVHVADIILGHIASMGRQMLHLYKESHIYPEVTWCVFSTCSAGNVCKECYAFWYSHVVCALC